MDEIQDSATSSKKSGGTEAGEQAGDSAEATAGSAVTAPPPPGAPPKAAPPPSAAVPPLVPPLTIRPKASDAKGPAPEEEPPGIGAEGGGASTEVSWIREDTLRLSTEDLPALGGRASDTSGDSASSDDSDALTVDFPLIPRTIEETGLGEAYLLDLTLKHVYFGEGLEAIALAGGLALDFRVVDELLQTLRQQVLIATGGGSGMLRGARIRYRITDKGRNRIEQILARDNYRGPAPVPFAQYVAQLGRQRIRAQRVTPEHVTKAFSRLVLSPEMLDHIGPAINSGKALFLYGPPGNGKTSLAECILKAVGGLVFIPRAVLLENEIVRVFDDLYHTPVALDTRYDERWVLSKRPVVTVGGELTLEHLDLTSTREATWYQAPFQVKANSGVLFIDDFGRQRCNPQELLNRWIVPLESGFDFLTFRSGQKVQVEFDTLVVFATNLDPKALVDEAFLRRIRYKIEITDPTVYQYKNIWSNVCAKNGIPYMEGLVDHVIDKHYRKPGRPLRCCHPRDILEQYVDLGRYLGSRPPLLPDLIDRFCDLYFVEL